MSQVTPQIPTDAIPQTELMRHVPPLSWVQAKLDDYRERAETLFWAAFDSGRSGDAAALEDVRGCLRHLCHAVERLAEAARHGREVQVPDELRTRLDHAFNAARTALNALHPGAFSRLPHCTGFQRSDGEIVFSSLLVVGASLRSLVPVVNRVYPDLYEVLLSKLVQQQHPVNEETLKPIA